MRAVRSFVIGGQDRSTSVDYFRSLRLLPEQTRRRVGTRKPLNCTTARTDTCFVDFNRQTYGDFILRRFGCEMPIPAHFGEFFWGLTP